MTQATYETLRYTCFLMDDILLIEQSLVAPRAFTNHCRPQETFYLRACFVQKKDAEEWRRITNKVGCYARMLKLASATV